MRVQRRRLHRKSFVLPPARASRPRRPWGRVPEPERDARGLVEGGTRTSCRWSGSFFLSGSMFRRHAAARASVPATDLLADLLERGNSVVPWCPGGGVLAVALRVRATPSRNGAAVGVSHRGTARRRMVPAALGVSLMGAGCGIDRQACLQYCCAPDVSGLSSCPRPALGPNRPCRAERGECSRRGSPDRDEREGAITPRGLFATVSIVVPRGSGAPGLVGVGPRSLFSSLAVPSELAVVVESGGCRAGRSKVSDAACGRCCL